MTSSTWGRRDLFRAEPWAKLFLDVLYENRRLARYQLHAFALMPNHFHLLLTVEPNPGLEKAVQYIKGGSSYRAGKELGSHMEVWQRGFDDQWIKDEKSFIEARLYAEPGRGASRGEARGISLLFSVSRLQGGSSSPIPGLKPRIFLDALRHG